METDLKFVKLTIVDMLKSTHREGMEGLLLWLEVEGFYKSPASTRFHGAYEGGLMAHSLDVFNKLVELLPDAGGIEALTEAVSAGQKPLELNGDAIIIAPLLHDICKVGAYIGNESPYKWNKKQPKGHARLSIERIEKFIKLTEIERMMIKFHMGVYGCEEFYEEDSWEFKTNAEYPMKGDHSKDDDMTKEESQEARYGQSLRNAWYHNPICKLMYFADELATMADKLGGE